MCARGSATGTHAVRHSIARTDRACRRWSASQVWWARPSASTPPPPPPKTTAARSPRVRCAPTRSARRERASRSTTRWLARRSPIGTRAAARSTAAPLRYARATRACPPRPSSKTATGARRLCSSAPPHAHALRTAYDALLTRCGSPLTGCQNRLARYIRCAVLTTYLALPARCETARYVAMYDPTASASCEEFSPSAPHLAYRSLHHEVQRLTLQQARH